MIQSLLLVLLSALVASVSAVTHRVNVGEHGLSFTPDNIKAAKGDKIDFYFYPGGHSVAHSLYKKPCKPTPDSFFSGYFTQKTGVADQKFTVVVNNTEPMFVYCASYHHCQEGKGMSMVVNEGRGQSMKSFKLRSRLALKTGTPAAVGGGTFSPSN